MMSEFRSSMGKRGVVALLVSAVFIAAMSALAAEPSSDAPPPALDDLTLRQSTEFGSTEGDELRDWLIRHAPDVVRAGAEAYAANCAVCHGDTGLGYAEARLSFPTDHRACTRCHRPGNEREMSFATMMERQHDLFDIGDPPAVRGDGSLAAFPTDDVLFAYLRATMPRYQPGRLNDDAYRSLVAFLRWLNQDADPGD